MDISLAIEALVPGAEYSGSVTANDLNAYQNIIWLSAEAQPPWEDVVSASDRMELEAAKEERTAFIRETYLARSVDPVPAHGTLWVGGYISGMKLDAAKRLSLEMGLPAVRLHDVDNTPHILTYEQATEIIHAIGYKYETDYAKKSILLASIDAVTLETAGDLETALAQVNAVAW
jgi:hypothetical protein